MAHAYALLASRERAARNLVRMGLTVRIVNLNVSAKITRNVIQKLANAFVVRDGKGSSVIVPATKSDSDSIVMRPVIVSTVVHAILKLVLFSFITFFLVCLCRSFVSKKANARVALDGLGRNVRKNAMDGLSDKIVVWNVIVTSRIRMHVTR